MNKKEQIEELASEIEKSLERAKSVVGSMNKGIGYWIAEDLVNKNYRKVIPNVDFVVRAGELSTIQMNARKETAKEIITFLGRFDGYANIAAEELVKKYGIEDIWFIEPICRLGDKVYLALDGCKVSGRTTVHRIETYNGELLLNGMIFGKTVFLTREEAEKKLKEIKEKESF